MKAKRPPERPRTGLVDRINDFGNGMVRKDLSVGRAHTLVACLNM